jgi:hypothetical protein
MHDSEDMFLKPLGLAYFPKTNGVNFLLLSEVQQSNIAFFAFFILPPWHDFPSC